MNESFTYQSSQHDQLYATENLLNSLNSSKIDRNSSVEGPEER
jgi:hypothetical protein